MCPGRDCNVCTMKVKEQNLKNTYVCIYSNGIRYRYLKAVKIRKKAGG